MNTPTLFQLIFFAFGLILSTSCNDINQTNQSINIKKAAIGVVKSDVAKLINNKNIVCFYDIDPDNFGLEWRAEKIKSSTEAPIIRAIEAFLDHHHFGKIFENISFQKVLAKNGENHYYFTGKSAAKDTQFQNFESALQMTIDRLDISATNRLFFR